MPGLEREVGRFGARRCQAAAALLQALDVVPKLAVALLWDEAQARRAAGRITPINQPQEMSKESTRGRPVCMTLDATKFSRLRGV